MTSRRIRDLRRLIEAEAQVYDARFRIMQTGRDHLRIVFSQGANHAFIITASTPSDWRYCRKVRADARRALRNLSA
jgi:hypothetical protein